MSRVLRIATLVVFAVALVSVTPVSTGAAPMDGMTGPVANVDLGTQQVHWSPLADYAGLRLTVSGPEGVEQLDFGPGESPSFDLAAMSDLADGLYSWELRAAPKLDAETQKLVAQMRSDDSMGLERQRPAGLPPAEQLVQSGSFRVLGGVIVQPAEEAPAPELKVQGAGANRVTGDLGVVTGKAQVISPDLVVYNSICVGFDCPTSPSFGADTIRLQENNLRIHVDDTSTAGSFPRTDWRLEFNSNLNGGGSYFRVIDASSNRNIMTLEANAPSHSLYVDDAGRVGFGTQNPVVELHAVEGDTPTLRLEQDTSSGFGAQTWDLAGNETSFFVRDATNGSTLPFRIFPGEASGALVIRNDGVGIGTTSPSEPLHVRRTDGSAKVLVEEASSTNASRELFELKNKGQVSFVFDNIDDDKWRMTLATSGLFFSRDGSGQNEFIIQDDGDVQIPAGSSYLGSDRNLKSHVVPVDPQDILRKVDALPVSIWSWQKDKGKELHMGPMAQDFHALFGLGQDDVTVVPLDVAGVSLAAIKGLSQSMKEILAKKDARITELEQRLAALEAAIAAEPQPGNSL